MIFLVFGRFFLLVGALSSTNCNRSLSDASLARIISGCPNLETLLLMDSEKLTSASMDSISSCKKLRYLSLNSLKGIEKSSLHKLSKLTKLRKLALSKNASVDGEFTSIVPFTFTKLEYLNIGANPIEDKNVDMICQTFSRLSTLFLGASSFLTDASLNSVAKCKSFFFHI